MLKDLLRNRSFRKTTSNLFRNTAEREIYEELDKNWNFCKHAKKNEIEITISVKDVLGLVLLTILDYRALYTDPTLLMQSYELWFCARDLDFLNRLQSENRKIIIKEFGDLYNKKQCEQIKEGWTVIKAHLAQDWVEN